MNKLIKGVAVVAAIAITTGLLGGCTGGNTSSGTNSTANKKQVELKIINFRVEDQKFYTDLNAKFQKAYPEVKILYDAVPTTQYNSLLDARLAAGEVDIFGVQSGMELQEQYATNMLDLKNADCLKGVNDTYLYYGRNSGKQVALPLNTVSMVVFYNKKIFADNGLAVPTKWSEFINVCKTLKDKKIDPIIYGGKDQWPINMVFDSLEPGIVRANAPNFFTDVKTGKASFKDDYWKELWTKLAETQTYFQPNSSGLAYSRAPGLFAQASAAMLIDGSWSLSQIIAAKPTFEYGAFILPSNEDVAKNKLLAFKVGSSMSIYANSAQKEYALKYLAMHLEDTNYQAYLDTTLMGSVKDNVKSNQKIYDEFYNNSTKVLLCENSLVLGMPWNIADYGTRMLLGKMTANDAFTRQASDIESVKDTWSANNNITH